MFSFGRISVPRNGGLSDYTTNLMDEWVANLGITTDANLVNIDFWDGRLSSTRLQATQGTELIPVNKTMAMTVSGQGFNLPSNPGIPACDWTFLFLTQQAAAQNIASGVWLFDSTATGGPRLIIQSETNTGDFTAQIQYNGVIKNFGYTIPFDSSEHVIGYRIRYPEADLLIDGVVVATVTGLTGGQMNMNSAATRRLLRGSGAVNQTYTGNIKKVRIYKEALSDANVSLISSPSSVFRTPVPLRPARFYNGVGQSNQRGNGASSGIPAQYQTPPNCYLWNNTTRVYEALNTTTNTLAGPCFSAMVAEGLKFPDYDLFFTMGAAGGTSMAVNWLPPSGTNYVLNKGYCDASLAQLTIQGRNPSTQNRVVFDYHGESDANPTYSPNYEPNQWAFMQAIDADLQPGKFITCKLNTNLPTGTYPAVDVAAVNAAKVLNAAKSLTYATIHLFDPTGEPLQGDLTHYTAAVGYPNIGLTQSSLT